jgi:hypothetical protein
MNRCKLILNCELLTPKEELQYWQRIYGESEVRQTPLLQQYVTQLYTLCDLPDHIAETFYLAQS